MDSRKYEVLIRVIDLGNITKAGEELGYTQAGVSYIIKELEAEFGFPLLIRTKKGVLPTTEARILLPKMKDIVLSNERFMQEVSNINGVVEGQLNIGTFPSTATCMLPNIIKKFQMRYPSIKINMHREGAIANIEAMLENNELDMAFLSYQKHYDYDWISLKEDRLICVMPMNYPDIEEEWFPLRRLEEEPFVMPQLGFDYDINNFLEKIDIHPNIAFEADDDFVILAMVESGLGISILPELILDINPYKVKTKKIETNPTRLLGVAIPSIRKLSPAGRKFVECLDEEKEI